MKFNSNYERIFISGTNGAVGSHLYSLLKRDFPTFKLERDAKNNFLIDNSKQVNRSCLIHFASKTPTNSKTQNFDINQIHLENLLNKLNGFNNSLDVIFASSMAVYDYELCGEQVHEESPISNSNFYGISKYKCELILKDFQTKGKIHQFVSLRLPGVLSPYGKAKHNFLLKALDMIKKDNDIKLYKSKVHFNNVVTSESIANFLRQLLKKDNFGESIINLASWPPCQLEELIKYTILLYKSQSTIHWVESSKGFTINIEKL